MLLLSSSFFSSLVPLHSLCCAFPVVYPKKRRPATAKRLFKLIVVELYTGARYQRDSSKFYSGANYQRDSSKFYSGTSYQRDSSKFYSGTSYQRDSSKFYSGTSYQRDSSKFYLGASYQRNFNSAAVPCRNHQKRLSPVTGAAFPAPGRAPISCQSLQLALTGSDMKLCGSS